MKYNFTIIIPHKNIPDLLNRCLLSIPHKDDIQIIVVDDASRNVEALEQLALSFPYVEFIYTKEGKGAGYARNVGLTKAKGEWLIFADADDYFSESFERLANQHSKDKADIIYFRAASVFSKSLKPSPRLDNRIAALIRYKEYSKKINDFCRYFYTEPWGKMVRRELVQRHNITFDETPIANDFYFSIVSGYFANIIEYDHSILYIYTEREGSLSNNYCANETVLRTRLGVYKKVQDFLDSHRVPYNPFYRFSVSESRNPNRDFSSIVEDFWSQNNLSKLYVMYRYVVGKLYQYTFGVHI